MRSDPNAAHTSVALFLVALFLLATPFADWWLSAQPPWYVPYLFWGGIVALGGWLIERGHRRGL